MMVPSMQVKRMWVRLAAVALAGAAASSASATTTAWWRFDDKAPSQQTTNSADWVVDSIHGVQTQPIMMKGGTDNQFEAETSAPRPVYVAPFATGFVYDPVTKERRENVAAMNFSAQPGRDANGPKDLPAYYASALRVGGAEANQAEATQPTDAITVECFVRSTATGKDFNVLAPIFAKRKGSGWTDESYALYMDGAGKMVARLKGVACFFNDSNRKYCINDGKWHHVALTYSASDAKVKVYVDYRLDREKTIEGGGQIAYDESTATPNLHALWIGGTANYDKDKGRRTFPGDIDELRISDTALKPEAFLRLETPDASVYRLTFDAGFANGAENNLRVSEGFDIPAYLNCSGASDGSGAEQDATTKYAGAAESPPLEARVDVSGRLVAPSFAFSLAAYLPGWEGLGGSLDLTECRTQRCWQVVRDGRPLFDAALDWRAETDGALVCTWTATCREPTELQCLGLMLKLPAADVVGRAWTADETTRVFPEAVNGTGGFGSGRAQRFAYPLAGGRTLTLDWEEAVPYHAQDGRVWGGTVFTRFGSRLNRHAYAAGEAVAFRVRIAVTGGISLRPHTRLVIAEGPQWAKFENRKDILAGSALDFSGMGLADAPAGKYGWLRAEGGDFAFEGRPGVRQRFYGVNLCGTANVPSHEDATALVMRLRRLGYNTIRVHHHDDAWQHRPDTRERLDFLIAEAIANGLYVTTDLYVSRKVKWRDIDVDRDGDVPVQLYKALCLCHEPAYRDWRRFAEAFLRHVNPYTGRAYADEPGMPFLSLVNEGDLAMGWQVKADDPRVRAAWKAFGGAGDTPAVRSEEFSRFDDHLMRTFTEKATRFVRALGAKALLTNDNSGPRHGEGEGATPLFDYVDTHFYIDHPRFLVNRWRLPSSCPNENPLRGVGVPLLNRGYARNASKPYAISEWNFSGPGKYRALGGILTGARAAQDGWDALWRFAYAHSRDHFHDSPNQAPGYFDCATDPLGQAGDRASVCLFLRGDADEGTLTTDATAGAMRFVSPRTCGGFSEGGDIDVGPVAVHVRGVPAAAWVSSLDGPPIPSASRLLAVHLTDVQGAGTVYADETRKILLKWGTGCLVEKGTAAFAVRLDRPEAYTVYALGTDGARLGTVPAEVRHGRLVFTASTATGVLHYEIVADK